MVLLKEVRQKHKSKKDIIEHIQQVQAAECKTLIQHVEHDGSSTIAEYIESYGKRLNCGPFIKVENFTSLYENVADCNKVIEMSIIQYLHKIITNNVSCNLS